MLHAPVGLDLHRLRHDESEELRRPQSVSLHLRLALTTPGHQRPADPEEWCGVLSDDVQWRKRPRRHDVEPPEALLPRLRPTVDHLGVAELKQRRDLGHELALTPVSLDQMDLRLRQRDRQRDTGHASTRAQVCDRHAPP